MLDSGVRLAAAFLPVGVPVIVGLVLAVMRRRSLPTVTGPAILGLALQLVVVIITTFLVAAASLQAFGLTPETLLPLSSALGFVVIVLQVLSWTLLLIALFRRLPSTTEPATSAPTPVPAMEQDRTPTGRHALLDDRGAQVVAEEGTTFLPIGGPRAEPSSMPPSSMPLPSMPVPGGGRPGPGTPARGYPAMGHPGPGRPMPGPPPVEDPPGEEPADTETFAAGPVPPVQDEPAAQDDERYPGSLQDAPADATGEDQPAEDTEYPGYLEGLDADEEPSDTGSIAPEQQEVPETAVFATAEPAEPESVAEDDVVADEDTVEEQAEDEDPAQDPAADEAVADEPVAEDPSDGPGDDSRDDSGNDSREDPTGTDEATEQADDPVPAGAATSAAAPTPGHYLGTPQRPQTPAPPQTPQAAAPPQSPEPPASRGGHPWFDPDGDAARRAAEHAEQSAQAEPVEQAGPPHASSTEGR
ncbi:hypothetical protein [Actinomycetospora sp. CA-053990]|uniref:hypothetical protein n=1 Tax=Actinomycetospora sp. CA-053990 TaxID=3239891 RepID=UPI003D8E5A41